MRGGRWANQFPQYRTARRFNRPSPLFRWALTMELLQIPGRALVFGAGLMAEATALRDLGWKVDALETSASLLNRRDLYEEWSAKSPGCRVFSEMADSRSSYDLVVITHVLEFVPSPVVRTRILRECARRLDKEAILLLSLRGWSDVNAAKRKTPASDGFVTGLGTWTRGFDVAEASKLVRSVGLEVFTGPRGIRSRFPEQVRLVCRSRSSK
jgi:hypothetical protein